MYIITNDQTYERVRMLNTSSSVRFIGESLPKMETLTGLVMVFSCLLYTSDAADE